MSLHQSPPISSGNTPRLSVVVVVVSDTTDGKMDLRHLTGCLEALAQQVDAPPLEILVPHLAEMPGVQELQQRFPEVQFLSCANLRSPTGGGSREHHDELRAIGLARAQGDLIALLEDHGRPAPQWAAALVQAHQQPYAAVGGAIENGVARALNAAVYYCDFGKYQNPVPRGESPFASDANLCYKRSALEQTAPVWQESFHETKVNGALRSSGEKLALCPEAVVYQHRGHLRLGPALRERFIWGRSFAASRCQELGTAKRLTYALLSPVLPVILLLRMVKTVHTRRRWSDFWYALPYLVLLLGAWSCGELAGYLTGSVGPRSKAPVAPLSHAGVEAP